MLHAACALGVDRAGNFHYDAPDGARKRDLIENVANFLLRGLGIADTPGIPCVEINHNIMVGGNCFD